MVLRVYKHFIHIHTYALSFFHCISSYVYSKTGRYISGARIGLDDIKESLSGASVDRTHCYICGPGPMIDEMENYLVKLDVPKENIHYEKWW